MPRRRGRGDELGKQIRLAARRGAVGASIVLVHKVAILLSQPGRGRFYKRRKGVGLHRASSPGEPPAVETGELKGSIRHVDMSRGNEIRVRVGTDKKKARWLEFGVRHMAPRPFMRPGLNIARNGMRRAIVDELKKLRF